MDPSLKAESEKLVRSWSQHESGWLRDYLVSGVEDPRVNLQSILTRHFLVQSFHDPGLEWLMEEEYRFSAAMNWLLEFARKSSDTAELEVVLFALERGADNAEGIEIPLWVTHLFGALPTSSHGVEIANYMAMFLRETTIRDSKPEVSQSSLNTFAELWRGVLGNLAKQCGADSASRTPLRVLEPACGSANDYRFFETYGLAPWLEYAGFDLCDANIRNARSLHPGICFREGNVFEIPWPDKSFDCCVVHDLFEHLSLEGMQAAVREISRVTRHGICAGFFQMDEMPEHRVRPVEEYHWNLLSRARTQKLFAELGFEAQVLHIGTFLRAKTGCDQFHNPNAYTLWLRARE